MANAESRSALMEENARLRERVQLLEDAIETMNPGLCMFDPEGRIALSNRRYAEVIGQPPDKIRPGMSMRELVELSIEAGYYGPETNADDIAASHWADVTAHPADRRRLERGGRSFAVESDVTTEGFVVATFDDVTARLRAEEALRESETRLRAILDTMPDSVKIFDSSARLVYVNPRCLELIEAPDLQTLLSSEQVPVSPEHLAEWMNVHARVLAGEKAIWSYDIIGLNGGRRHVEAHSAPIRLPDGSRGHMCISRDISERKEAEDALRRSEAFLSAVVETTPACIKVVAPDGTLRQMNSAGLRMIGAKDFASIESSCVFDLIAAEDRPDWREKHARVCAGESLVWQSEIIGPGGARLHTETHAAPIQLPDGQSAHLAITHDITNRKQAERALRESEQRLRVVQEATGLADFVTSDEGIVSSSGRFFEQIGLPPRSEPIKFAEWLEHVHPDDREWLHEEVLRAMSEEERIACEFRVVRADTGEIRWLATHTAVERNQAGEVIGTIGAHLDITERKRAEEALRESERRMQSILTSMPDCVKIFDQNSNITYINPRGLDLLEAPDLETFTASGHVPVSAEYLPECIEVHQRVLAGETIVWNYEIVGMNGGRCHVEAHSVPISLPDGSHGHMCISRDISERKEAEDALRRSEQRLRLIQDATGLADFETTPFGITSYSDRFFDQIGIPPRTGEIKFADWLECVHPEDRERLQSELDQRLREENLVDVDFRIVRGDTGEVRWLSSHCSVERDAAGEPVRCIGAHLDITDRKRTEEALRASEMRLSAILDSMPDCVKLFDENFNLTYINPRGLKLLEAPDLEAFNASGHVPVPEEYLPQCADVHTRVIAGESVVWTYEILGMKGARRDVEAHSVPFTLPDGARAHMCISRDVSERKAAEDALRRSEQRLRLVQEATGLADFEAEPDGVAHVSEALIEQLGLPEGTTELTFEQLLEYVHPDDRGYFTREIERALESRETFQCEFRIVRGDSGEVRWIYSRTKMERDEDGNALRSIGAHLDITERKQAEEALRESEERFRTRCRSRRARGVGL